MKRIKVIKKKGRNDSRKKIKNDMKQEASCSILDSVKPELEDLISAHDRFMKALVATGKIVHIGSVLHHIHGALMYTEISELISHENGRK